MKSLFVFVFIFIFSINDLLVLAVDSFFQACSVPKACGDHTITYPFYIKGLQQPYCGYPGFEVSCDTIHGRPILNLSGTDYFIRRIFYQTQLLVVSNAALASAGNCIPPIRNLSLSSDGPFRLASGDGGVVLFYNCSTVSLGADLGKYRLGCDGDAAGASVLAVPEGDGAGLAAAARRCGAGGPAAVPVMGFEEGEGLREVMSRGFGLNWTAADCGFCNRTGGKCGFDYVTHHFKCFCPDRPHAARCDPLGQGKSPSLAIKVEAAIASIVAGIGILIIVLCLMKKSTTSTSIFFWKKQNQIDQTVETFLKSHGPLEVRRYSFQEIKKITRCFAEKLGQGGFGNVYKGKLDDDSLVAVKVLNQSKGDDGQGFMNEVATISRTSHVNVVTLLGFCSEVRKRALLYEFMPNGSLARLAYEASLASENSQPLNWERKYQIALGIARGLEYLHRGCNMRIVHFDIKPHNILLDANFVPKIADFGLAKICAERESIISMSIPRGTIGYIAPEVFSRNFGEVSHKSDVYSYGMMILEMVGGRKNVNNEANNTSETYFPHWIYRRLELDEELVQEENTKSEDELKVRKMIVVSLWCIQTDPSKRPTISRVIEMLESSLDSLQIPPNPF